MTEPQVLDHSGDLDQRISALESDVDAIKTNQEGLVGMLDKSIARSAEEMRELRETMARGFAHTDDKIQSLEDKIQSLSDTMNDRFLSLNDNMHDRFLSTREDLQKKMFRDEQRQLRGEIKEEFSAFRKEFSGFKEEIRDSFNRFKWTFGIVMALAVAVLKFLP